jgi:ACS family hexuronate transporter-like MFS transporter
MTWTRSKVGIVSALWFFYFVNYLDRVAISIAGPSMMKSLSISAAEFGMMLSSFGIGYVLAQVPGGLIADKWGARITLVVSPLFWALFTGLSGLVYSVFAFVVVRFCFGLAEGIAQGPTYRAVAEAFDSRQRSRALAIVVSAATLAPAFAGALVGYLIADYGWQAMFLMLAAPALAAAAISYWLLPRGLKAPAEISEPKPSEEVAFVKVLLRPSLWLLSLSQFGYNFVTWGYSGWLPSYLAMARHIDLKSVGLLSSIPYLFGFFGLLAGGWLGSGRLHAYRPQLVAACYLLAGLSMYVAYRADGLTLSLAGLAGTSFFLYAGYGPKGAVMLDLAPVKYQAAYVGVVSTVGQAGAVVAPAAIGFLVTATGAFTAGFGMMIAALIVSAASLMVLTPLLATRPQLPTAS